MSKWFFSLQFRLVLGFAVAIALALASVSVYIGFAAHREVDRVERLGESARTSRVEAALGGYYSVNGGWHGVETMLEQVGFVAGVPIAIVDVDGEMVADSLGPVAGSQRQEAPWPRRSAIKVGDATVGSVLYGPFDFRKQRRGPLDSALAGARFGNPNRGGRGFGPGPAGPESADPRFSAPPFSTITDATNRSLLLAGVTAGAAGILLVSLFSRRALSSVRALNVAARGLAMGDLSQRVPTGGRDEIGELSRTFNGMAEALERAEAQRRNLVADVAHELRTPLTNVQGYVEAVRDGVLEPDSATIETIHQQVLYLARLMDDLRLLAETEAEDFRLRVENDSLVDVVEGSVEAFRPRAEAKGVALTAETPPDFPQVRLDRTRVAQVIGNLITNALRHTPAGGEVAISIKVVGDSVARVTVADTGEGIPSEDLPFVFERFYRADPSRTRSTGGVGLGLTIAKKLVEAHGGSINVANTTGSGSRFIVDLPLAGPSEQA